MPRNYEKESAWQKKQYKRFQALLKHDEAEILQKHLADNGISFTAWIREKLKEDCENES